MTTRKNTKKDKWAKAALAAIGVAIAYSGYLTITAAYDMGYNRGERDASIAILSKLVF